MVTDRARIQSYFADTEEKAIQDYANKHRLTLSKAAEALVKKGLSEGSETPEGVVLDMFYDQRIDALSERLEDMARVSQGSVDKVEKLEYQVCCLQEDFDKYKRLEKGRYPVEYSDDRIAAITGQRIETVREWRHKLRKPRGKRVLKALEGIRLEEGRWIKPY
ncbi:MAG: hypothetical protein ACRC2S_10590 [Waterburya sp.]